MTEKADCLVQNIYNIYILKLKSYQLYWNFYRASRAVSILTNGTIFNNLERPHTQIARLGHSLTWLKIRP